MNSILVIRGGALGDFMVTLPACRLLRQQWPEARIEFLGNTTFGELGHGRFYFDGVRSLERGSLARFFVPRTELDSDWCDYFSEFDLIISYLYDPDEFFHTNLSRCTLAQIIRQSPQVKESPAARHFCEPLKVLGLETKDFISHLYLKSEEDSLAENHLLGKKNILAFHPGSGSPTKNWPLPRWRELLGEAQLRGYCPLLIAGEAEQENWRELSSLTSLHALGLTLPHLAALLKKSQVFIGHDSGVTHVAAATRTPTIALFGPTNPEMWAPPGENVTIYQGGADWKGFEVSTILSRLQSLSG